MSIQFAGSKSVDDRRRRRLVVNFDDPGAEGTATDEDPSAIGLSSELVDSEAAAPWIPVYEWRIWTYAALLGLIVLAASFALSVPTAFRQELAPITQHLLQGQRPVLAVLIQTTFLFLAAQLALLIGWYRSRCKIDFRGRYRVWPWAAAWFGMAALFSATDAHELIGQIVSQSGLVKWRPEIVCWLLPACLTGFPLWRLLDGDVRRSRSSLVTLRLAGTMGTVSGCLELFASDLTPSWIAPARIILPMVAATTIFVALVLNARVVAYVCPDPPSPEETPPRRTLAAVVSWLASFVLRPRTVEFPVPEFEEEVKPKRGRKKATTDEEEATATTKRKRRAPAKRTTKPRTRTKPADPEEVEEESVDEPAESSYGDESGDASSGYESDTEQAEVESTDWTEQADSDSDESSLASADFSSNGPSSHATWQKPVVVPEQFDATGSDDEDEDAEDGMLRRDAGVTADQLKGLSKRQKRELRKQSREQQRNQRR